MAEILIATLNFRAGPGLDFDVIGRGGVGERYPVISQMNACTWLQIMLEDATLAGISGASAYTRLSTSCTAIPVPVVEAVLPTLTQSALSVTRAAPTATPTLVQPATPTPIPTVATPPLGEGGPTTVRIDSPADGLASADMVTFIWTPDQSLTAGQVYELAFWHPSETWNAGKALSPASRDTSSTIRLSNLAPGAYVWGVILGALDKNESHYQRLRYLGGGQTIQVLGDNGGSQDDTRPSDPHVGEK